MPNVHLGRPNLLRAALKLYRAEIQHIVDPIIDNANLASLDPEAFIPEEIGAELQRLEIAERVVARSGGDGEQAFGQHVDNAILATLHSALLLERDALADLLRRLDQDQMIPPESKRPVAQQLQQTDGELERFWSEYGQSELLPRLQRQRTIRGGGFIWQPLDAWLLDQPDATRRRRTWCVCDTNFFLESRATFDQVAWPSVWDLDHVVLVVPAAIAGELDDFKSHPRRRLSDRARGVLQRLEDLAGAVPPGPPAPVRDRVEVLMVDHEPPVPEGLDRDVADDRLIATALDLRTDYRLSV